MPNPVTTTDLFLQEVAGLLTEIRDLLRERPADTPQQAEPAAASPATSKPAKRAAKKT